MKRQSGEEELNGDLRLRPKQRLVYLARNLVRNLRGGFFGPTPRAWAGSTAPHVPKSGSLPSPSRVLAETFVKLQLPLLLDRTVIKVLDVGCGSGRICHLLADAGFTGHYTGVDVDARFAVSSNDRPEFEIRFVRGNIHEVDLECDFDLIFSLSALEHIPEDAALIQRVRGLLKPTGGQVHIVPSGWALPLYLWHGYRQYSRGALALRFDPDRTRVYRLGGAATFAVHLFWITLPEILLRVSLRKLAPASYRWILVAALGLDRWFPAAAAMYAVYENAGAPEDATEVRV